MKPIQIETFLQYRFLSAPAFSPDGQRVAFIVKQAKGNGYTSDILCYDIPAATTSRLTDTGDIRLFCFTNAGNILLARPCPANPHGTALFELSADGIAPRGELPVSLRSLAALPDGRFVAVADYRIPGKANEPDAAYDVFEELPLRWNAVGLVNGVRRRIYLIDTAMGSATPVTGDDFFVGNLTTSPWQLSADEKHILFIGQQMTGVQKQNPGLYVHDIAVGTTRCLIPDGEQKIEIAQLLGDCAIVTATRGEEYGTAQMPEFFRIDLKTGALTLIRRYEYSTGAAITTDSTLGAGATNLCANGAVYFTTMQGHSTRVRRIELDGTLSEPLTPEGSCNSFDVCGEHIAWVGMHGDRLQELYLDGQRVTDLNAAILEDYAVSTPREITSCRPGGEEVTGWIIPPIAHVPGTPCPAILNIHGGPHAAFGPTYFHEMQVWASAGYYVLYCNPHGSDGKGNAFGDMRGRYGTIDYDDLMAFVDAALLACPDIDAKRLGVTGGSYGGYMTNWIIGHTDRFRCAASQRSIADWSLSELVSDCGFQRNAPKMGASVFEDHAKVWDRSPVKYAPNVVTPTLFLHSYEDYRCHHSQAVAMFTAIRQRGIESRLCIFKGENHELSRSGKPNNRISRMREILSWMDAHLKA